jgi:hypothetical protein
MVKAASWKTARWIDKIYIFFQLCVDIVKFNPIMLITSGNRLPLGNTGIIAMAENESLDLAKPGGQRWMHLLDAVRKKKTPSEIARQVELKLPQSLRKAFKEFAEQGVTLDDLISSHDDPAAPSRLVRKCEGHEFAQGIRSETSQSVNDAGRRIAGHGDWQDS